MQEFRNNKPVFPYEALRKQLIKNMPKCFTEGTYFKEVIHDTLPREGLYGYTWHPRSTAELRYTMLKSEYETGNMLHVMSMYRDTDNMADLITICFFHDYTDNIQKLFGSDKTVLRCRELLKEALKTLNAGGFYRVDEDVAGRMIPDITGERKDNQLREMSEYREFFTDWLFYNPETISECILSSFCQAMGHFTVCFHKCTPRVINEWKEAHPGELPEDLYKEDPRSFRKPGALGKIISLSDYRR